MRCFEWLCLCSLVALLSASSYGHRIMVEEKVLHVGEELLKEILPLQNGARLYNLQGLRPQIWYEVKISYPASGIILLHNGARLYNLQGLRLIPSIFSLQLKQDTSDLGLNQGRKLLNTEKLIFKTLLPLVEQGQISVLVNVESEGVVAIPGKREREHVMFNIVCDELLLGIPHKAWYVVVLVVVCLILAFVVPSFLPPYLLPKNERLPLSDCTVTKDS